MLVEQWQQSLAPRHKVLVEQWKQSLETSSGCQQSLEITFSVISITIDIIVLPWIRNGRLETAMNTDSIRRFQSALTATVCIHGNRSNRSKVYSSRVFLGPLSYQWTELSLCKGQEQSDL